ncbi:MFS transporter [Bacteroides stercorirosoris]|uniref:MFS transporter n=1 Tax=Bacteroides stercorirosoris TaxID=871324 RepID=UPI0023F8211C|nr:MFS transporter [Bacteroides stercorirosoris]
MRKSNIDNLWSLGFMRMCFANFLLFASIYALFPVLPSVMVSRLGISTGQAGSMFLVFAAAMFLVGPFHAYLGDEYKRKHVLVYSTFVMLGATLGYVFVDTFPRLLLLAAVQGAAFGLATTAGITVAIDITASSHRSAGNMGFALAARLGMLVGVGVGVWMFYLKGFSMVAYLSILCGIFSILFSLRVYVAFRAPIGVSRCNLDRFLLLRGWIPAINLMLIAFIPGVALPLIKQGDYSVLFFLVVLVVLTIPFTKIFVKLSHHCQRGTANTTCHLFMDAGLLIGMAVCCFLSDNGNEQLHFYTDFQLIYKVIGIAILVALAFYFLLTGPYYKRKRVR